MLHGKQAITHQIRHRRLASDKRQQVVGADQGALAPTSGHHPKPFPKARPRTSWLRSDGDQSVNDGSSRKNRASLTAMTPRPWRKFRYQPIEEA